MKVLLTGGNGFVGSHIVDLLCAEGVAAAVLLRPTSDTGFIADRLDQVEARTGSLGDADSLRAAMRGVEVVIHCAGKTKVVRRAEYDEVNRLGTRNVVEAVNANRETVRHLVHISSLAVTGPGLPDAPALETAPPRPVSEYGRSKLRGEEEVIGGCRVPWTILRPAAVYGPRDRDFLAVFQAVRRHLMPLFGGGARPLSLVYVADVAAAVRCCLDRAAAHGKVYHVAADAPSTSAGLMREIAAQLDVRALRIPVPVRALYPLCLAREALTRLTGRADILSRGKYAELAAPGWVCSTARMRDDLGFAAPTALPEGVARTIAWYRREEWLKP